MYRRTSDDERDRDELQQQLGEAVRPLAGDADLDPVLDAVGDRRCVLLGEASHGTSEFYSWRARLTRRLIREKGFDFVAVEGDWPDLYLLNRYVKGDDAAGESATAVLGGPRRWPAWMWSNWEVAAFAEWLREHNGAKAPERRVGFYGLDVYSLWESLEAVMGYLEERHPDALATARRAFACFEPYAGGVEDYAQATALVPTTCEEEVSALLGELRRRPATPGKDGDSRFAAEQNALVTVNAERYYRAMLRGGPQSWNIRDRHMMETLERLLEHHGEHAKAVVWEHNTHVGDARHTDMADDGMVNVGQLARERYGDGAFLLGFGGYTGTVVAASSWGAEMQEMEVPPARSGSWEEAFHGLGGRDLLLLSHEARREGPLSRRRGHRAIGVVYRPQFESFGNYVPTDLLGRYDAFLFIDESRALHPLPSEAKAAPPDTYPWGI